MAEHAQPGLEPSVAEKDDPVEVASRPGAGVVLAAILAIAASGSLAWWFAASGRSAEIDTAAAPPPPPPASAPVQPIRYAPGDPDPGEVRRAWRDVQQGYADGGPETLVRASQACARGVPADPRLLDYCLAYDIYASAVAPEGEGDWFAQSGDRGLALARMALPEGVDAHNRIAQVAALTRAVLPKAEPARPRPQPVHAVRHARPTPHAHALKVRHSHKPAAAKPKLLKTHVYPPARRGRPGAYDAQAQARDAQVRALDDFGFPSEGDPLDPPH